MHKMNKHKNSMKLLIIFHYLICCKLTFDLERKNKLHILNIHYYKCIFKNFLKSKGVFGVVGK
jgi:hypothetical protein